MPDPVEKFDYIVRLSKTSAGVYKTTSPSLSDQIAIQDYTDRSLTMGDNLTQLGDIAGDHYNVTSRGVSTSTVGIYNGMLADKTGFVGHAEVNNNNYYSLYTNKSNYPSGVNVRVVSSPFVITCYLAGTLIKCAHGDVVVENLKAGDLAVTASGRLRPIRWTGHRLIDCDTLPDPSLAMPVMIAAHAFGPNKPSHSLYVSPGHSICVNFFGEMLIPAIAMVNGSSISQVSLVSITYWHVELETHDIILANNLAAESYLDMANRDFFFENETVVSNASPDAVSRTHAQFCRPYYEAGPFVDAIHACLRKRAEALNVQDHLECARV